MESRTQTKPGKWAGLMWAPILIPLAVWGLSYLPTSGPTAAQEKSTAETRLIASAQEDVMRSLKDSGSAQFGKTWINTMGIVCGAVNARNSFGGYTGETAFYYDPAERYAVVVPVTDTRFGRKYDAKKFAAKGCPSGIERYLNIID